MSRPSSGAQARVQFQPPKPDVAEVDHHYLDRRQGIKHLNIKLIRAIEFQT